MLDVTRAQNDIQQVWDFGGVLLHGWFNIRQLFTSAAMEYIFSMLADGVIMWRL